MKVVVYSAKSYDQQFLNKGLADAGHEVHYLQAHLSAQTAVLAQGYDAVCVFVNDTVDHDVVKRLADAGVRLVVLRCAGYNNVDVGAAQRAGITVMHVPAYSPHAVAEYTVALMLALNRKIHRAYNRVRDGNFTLDGLLGFDMVDKTVGIVGTGAIGAIVAHIMTGFGCNVLACDPNPRHELLSAGVRYTNMGELLSASRIITLHCPLTPETYHLINDEAIAQMHDQAMLINTSRGAVVDAQALINGIKSGKLGSAALDVYEEEADIFFEDISSAVMRDDILARLTTFPNIIITAHQAYFTTEALTQIASTTARNITTFENHQPDPRTTLHSAVSTQEQLADESSRQGSREPG